MAYHHILQIPMFASNAIRDGGSSPIADNNILINRFYGVGVETQYSRNAVGSHLIDLTNG